MIRMIKEFMNNTKAAIESLEDLKHKHNSILNGLLTSLKDVQEGKPIDTDVKEKITIIQNAFESIELGLGEAQVMMILAEHLQTVEAEIEKLKAQVKRLCEETSWLSEELFNTQQKLQASEVTVAQLEVEKKHLLFMNALNKYGTKKAKDAMKQMAGGDDNPMVAFAQKISDTWKLEDWQEKMHEEFNKGTAQMQKAMQPLMDECEKMKHAGASKEEMKKKFTEMVEKMTQSS